MVSHQSEAQESLVSPLDRRSEVYRHAAQSLVEKKKALQPERILNVPNVLTFLRLLLVPVLIALWEWQHAWSPLACAVVFIAASLTDWLDGFLARQVCAAACVISFSIVMLALSPAAQARDCVWRFFGSSC